MGFTAAGSLFEHEHTLCHCVCVLHRELQALAGGGGCAHEASKGQTARALQERVRQLTLLLLAERQPNLSATYSDLLDEYGVRLCVIGRVSMLPEDVQEAVRHAEELTRHNNKCVP